jgi:hypothetical protein
VTCRGVVRGNVVVLDETTRLPDGTVVEIRVPEATAAHEDPFAALLARRAANANLRVRMDEIIEEDKQERETHPDIWLSSRP